MSTDDRSTEQEIVDSGELHEDSSSEESHIPPEILENLPPEERERVSRFFGATMTMGGMMNPIASKVTSQHIADMIALSGRESDHDFEDRKHSRLTITLFAVFSIIAMLVLITVLAFQGMTDLLFEIIKVIAIGAGGFSGGYGYSSFRRRQ